MGYDKLAEMIKRHEGYRDRIYRDSVGVLTVGWGCALHEGKHFPAYVNERLFRNDFIGAIEDYKTLQLDLDSVREAVVIDMIFNLGIVRFKKFKNTIKHIRAGEYEDAAQHMLDSKWAKQVKSRAVELAEMMRTGVWPDWFK
jgi:lysozyme